MKKNVSIDSTFVFETRHRLGLNQSDFWTPLGVTQSGGSRYESGRRMPRTLRKLVWLVHVVGLDSHLLQRLGKV